MGRRSALSAHHRAVIGSNLMSPRRRRRCRDARREGPSGSYGKFSTTVIATLAGQQEKLLWPARWAQASSRFQSSRDGMGGMAMSVANCLKTWGKDFLGIGEHRFFSRRLPSDRA
jgi:hypothetical protein